MRDSMDHRRRITDRRPNLEAKGWVVIALYFGLVALLMLVW